MLCTWCNGTGKWKCVDPYDLTIYEVECDHCDENGDEREEGGC